jgi:hypothetical protein
MKEQRIRDRVSEPFMKFLERKKLGGGDARWNPHRQVMFELFLEGYKAAMEEVHGKKIEDIPEGGDLPSAPAEKEAEKC